MQIPTLKIGPYELSSPFVLAPMAGVTDKPFRRLCRRFGAGMTTSEMTTADTSLWQTAKSRRRLESFFLRATIPPALKESLRQFRAE